MKPSVTETWIFAGSWMVSSQYHATSRIHKTTDYFDIHPIKYYSVSSVSRCSKQAIPVCLGILVQTPPRNVPRIGWSLYFMNFKYVEVNFIKPNPKQLLITSVIPFILYETAMADSETSISLRAGIASYSTLFYPRHRSRLAWTIFISPSNCPKHSYSESIRLHQIQV